MTKDEGDFYIALVLLHGGTFWRPSGKVRPNSQWIFFPGITIDSAWHRDEDYLFYEGTDENAHIIAAKMYVDKFKLIPEGD